MTTRTDRPTLAAPDDDPFLWLEDIEGEDAAAWVDERTAETLRRFGGARYDQDRFALAALFDRPDRIPGVTRRGAFLYNVWQDAEHPRGMWRRTTLASYREPNPDWDVLLDLDALARDEGEDWIWSGSSIEPTQQRRTILRLSRGGSDAVVLREFDLETRSFVPEGFVLPEAKGGIDWLDPETLLLSSAFGDGMATTSGYARTVRLWRRGQDPRTAEVLFETEATAMSAWGDVDRTAKPPRLWFVTKPGFFDAIGWLGDRTGAKERIDLPTDAVWQVHDDVLLVKPRTPWSVAGRTYEPDQLLGLSFAKFMAGDRDFEVLFEPAARRSLENFAWAGDRLALSILDNLAPRFVLLRFVEGVWEREELETLPQTGVVTLRRLDAEAEDSDGTVLVSAQDPITPPTLMLMNVAASTNREPGRPQAKPCHFRCRGSRRDAPRGRVARWGADPLYADRAGRRDRRRPGPSDGLRRFCGLRPADLPHVGRQALVRARRDRRRGQYPGRRRVRHALARGGPAGGQAIGA